MIYIILVMALAASMVIGICAGQYPVAPGKVLSILAGWGERPPTLSMDERIVTLLRGPRIVLVAICGAGLAISGAAMQGVFRNPLAAPELLGVSSGAAFGGATAILAGFGGAMLLGGAFTAGLLALVMVGAISRVNGRSDTTTVILTGVIVGAFFSALVSITQLLADPYNSLPAIVFWLMGSFATATWDKVLLATPAIFVGGGLLWMIRFRINILSLGDEEAGSLGVPVERDRWLIFFGVTLVIATTVSVAGIIGWVGIVVPHVARLLIGQDHRHLLPASALLGASYLCIVDTLARGATSTEVPLGVLTAVIGAPFVAFLLRRRHTAEEDMA
ncbi:FecCD family ABC transporter permease [Ensifer sp. NPDC090286]|uniref:FecCD family ABC transporter permease n=1 Tax=Ensifer sp. NPDC090286 TaxID=3363991 RepID=UPI00383BEAAE